MTQARPTCSMCDTSNNEELLLVWSEELMTLRSEYWTGIDQPAKGTILPPLLKWKSKSGVFLRSSAVLNCMQNIRYIYKFLIVKFPTFLAQNEAWALTAVALELLKKALLKNIDTVAMFMMPRLIRCGSLNGLLTFINITITPPIIWRSCVSMATS